MAPGPPGTAARAPRAATPPPPLPDPLGPLPRRPSVWRSRRVLWAVLFGLALAWSLAEAGLFTGPLVNPGGWVQVRHFVEAALRPRLDGAFLGLVGHATLVTLAFAVCGTVLSLVIGTLGGVLSSETWWRSLWPARTAGGRRAGGHRAPWVLVRAVLALPRAIHEIVWGLLFVAVLGLDPLVGILAIAIPFGAITAKVFSEILDESSHRPLDALLSAGAPPTKAFLYGLLPAAFPDLLSYAFYRFECSIRSAAVLGIIGAGGLGYQIFLSLQSLAYGEMWTFLLALVLLSGLTDLWSTLLRRHLGSSHRVRAGLRRTRPSPGGLRDAEVPGRPWTPVGPRGGSLLVRGSVAMWLVLLVFSFWYVDAGWSKLWAERTGSLVAQVLADALPPGLGGLSLAEFVDLSGRTLAMSILAIAVAGAGGLLLSFPAAHNFLLPRGILNPGARRGMSVAGTAAFAATRALLLFLRAVPAPIWALILLFVLFPGILPGALALGLYTLGVLGRLMAEVTENLDARPLRTLRAQGASGPGVFLYGVLPATAARNTAYLLYRWEVAIRATAMVGVVGAGGLGRLLAEQLSDFDYAAVTTTLLFYVVLTFLVDMVSALVRRDLR